MAKNPQQDKKMTKNDILGFLLLLVLFAAIIVALVILVPFGQIYAVNTLFKTEIEYSWWNWLLVLFLTMSVRSVSYNKNNKNNK
jgi:ABC-type multidrug transport system fused ATPase/permease subunit